MRTVFFFLRVLAAAAAVMPLRLVRGRRRPTWSKREEFLRTIVRTYTDGAVQFGLPWAKRTERLLPRTTPLARMVETEKTTIAGVPCIWCRPKKIATSHYQSGQRVLLYLHGGGYALGSPSLYRDVIARLAIEARARVLAPDYRLAPRHPFPAAQDDCLAVYRGLLEVASQSQDACKIALAGDSAGGALVVSVLQQARDQSLEMPVGAVLFSPWVDPRADDGSMAENDHDDSIGPGFISECLQAVLSQNPETGEWGPEIDDPRLAPLRADLRGLPPLMVQVGTAEVFLDQVQRFAERASEAGVDTTLKVYEDLFHLFWSLAPMVPRAESAVGDSATFLRQRFGVRADGTPRSD